MLSCSLWLVLLVLPTFADSPVSSGKGDDVRTGRVHFRPPDRASSVPEPFRLAAHTFSCEQQPLGAVSDKVSLYRITFPSPVETSYAANNTVHCEYFQPTGEGKMPAVVVLHILGGDFPLSRLFCSALSHHGVAALFLKMPYYGPRRDSSVSRRMISPNPQHTVEGMTQAILDIRRATALLAERAEINAQQLGVFGISLGGITAGLAAGAEPRLQSVCMVLAGGDIAKIVWDSPRLVRLRREQTQAGVSRGQFYELLAQVDPVRYAENVHGRGILMLNAKDDEVIPRSCTESLWLALNKPEIVWYEGGHYSASRNLFDVLSRVTRFFTSDSVAPE